jgi:hypothetical protein
LLFPSWTNRHDHPLAGGTRGIAENIFPEDPYDAIDVILHIFLVVSQIGVSMAGTGSNGDLEPLFAAKKP